MAHLFRHAVVFTEGHARHDRRGRQCGSAHQLDVRRYPEALTERRAPLFGVELQRRGARRGARPPAPPGKPSRRWAARPPRRAQRHPGTDGRRERRRSGRGLSTQPRRQAKVRSRAITTWASRGSISRFASSKAAAGSSPPAGQHTDEALGALVGTADLRTLNPAGESRLPRRGACITCLRAAHAFRSRRGQVDSPRLSPGAGPRLPRPWQDETGLRLRAVAPLRPRWQPPPPRTGSHVIPPWEITHIFHAGRRFAWEPGMKPITRILCLVHFNEQSLRRTGLGSSSWRQATRATVVVMHAYEPPALYAVGGVPGRPGGLQPDCQRRAAQCS